MSTLDDHGRFATATVSIDVGRPRLPLQFAVERLRSASADAFANIVMAKLV